MIISVWDITGMECTSPHILGNAELVNTPETELSSSHAIVVCKEGFVQTGASNILKCINGVWSGDPLSCSKCFEKGNPFLSIESNCVTYSCCQKHSFGRNTQKNLLSCILLRTKFQKDIPCS